MKVVKSILIYASIIIGLLLTTVLICCVILIVSPNTTILGFKYVSYKDVTTINYNSSSLGHDIATIEAIDVKTGSMDIEFLPNTSNSNQVTVTYNPGLSGFVKAEKSKLNYTMNVVEKSFEMGGPYKTIEIDITEPEGMLFTSGSYITVMIPTSMNNNLQAISATTKNGGITFNSKKDKKTIKADDFYARTTAKGMKAASVTVTNPNFDNYYVKTAAAELEFKEATTILGNVTFHTQTGKLSCTNKDKTGTIAGNLEITSEASVGGINVNVDRVSGNIAIRAKAGIVNIRKIGAEGLQRSVAIYAGTVQFDFKEVWGSINAVGYNPDDTPSINFKIGKLITTDNDSYFKTGTDDVTIDEAEGNITFLTSSGAFKVKKMRGNISGTTRSGTTDVTFDKDKTTAYTFNITTTEGNITGSNIRGKVDIEIKGSTGRSRTINLNFITVANGCEIIGQRDYKVNIKAAVTNKYLIMSDEREILSHPSGILFSRIESVDSDYGAYGYNLAGTNPYRVGYSENEYREQSGSIRLTTGGLITVGTIIS